MARVLSLLHIATLVLGVCDHARAVWFAETPLACRRLPRTIEPLAYDIELNLLSAYEELYEGHVNVSFKYVGHQKHRDSDEHCSHSYSARDIVMHADPSIELTSVEIYTQCGQPIGCFSRTIGTGARCGPDGHKRRQIFKFTRDADRQLIAFKLMRAMTPETTGKLSIGFRNSLRDNARGIYVSKDVVGPMEHRQIVSQFQPTGARLAFPVFDEPHLKATFKLSIVHQSNQTAYSNTEPVSRVKLADGPYARTTFEETPPMSPHMLAFAVGCFDEPLETVATSYLSHKDYKVRVITAPSKQMAGQFAHEVASKAVAYFEYYLSNEFPLRKLDIIAIAELRGDRSESWGLSFVRDTSLWIDSETSAETRTSAAINVALVCAQQWIGNLVSPEWWTELWITKGIAQQMAFKSIHELYPELESEFMARITMLSPAMDSDACGSIHAISPPINQLRTPDQIEQLYDELESVKSGAVVQALVRMRPDAVWYRTSLRDLVNRFAKRTFTHEHIELILKSFLPLSKRMNGYVLSMLNSFKSISGVPLINVVLDENRKRVWNSLELMNGAQMRPASTVPRQKENLDLVVDQAYVKLLDNDSTIKFTSYMHSEKVNQSLGDWTGLPGWWNYDGRIDQYIKLSPNPDLSSYYRVRYTDELYRLFKKPIELRLMSPMDRLQILNDAHALVKAGLIGRKLFEEMYDYFRDEDNSAVLHELIDASKTLNSLKASGGSVSLTNQVILRIYNLYGRFGVTGNESVTEQLVRNYAIKELILNGHQEVIDEALTTFEQERDNLAIFLRESIYMVIVKYGTREQVDKLLAKMWVTKSYEERLRLATALAYSEHPALIENLHRWVTLIGLKSDAIREIRTMIKAKIQAAKL